MSKQSFRQVFVAPVVTQPAADANTTALTAGQVGIFEVPSYDAKLDFNTVRRVQIFQGTPDFELPAGYGIPNFSRRSIEFDKTAIKAARLKTPVSAQARIITLGYDGANTAKSMTLKCDQKKYVTITLTGVPINQEMGHLQGITRTFILEAPKCGDCPTPSDPCANVDPSNLATDLKAQIDNDPILSKYLVTTVLTANSGLVNEASGLRFETNIVKRDRSSIYLFGKYPYEADVVHVEVASYDYDYNGLLENDTNAWVVTETQALRYPSGLGEYVREQERKSLQHELKEYSCNPGILEAEGFEFNAVVGTNYDEYQLEVSKTNKVEGFGSVTDEYIISIYVAAGTGRSVGQLGTTINNLVQDAGLPALF